MCLSQFFHLTYLYEYRKKLQKPLVETLIQDHAEQFLDIIYFSDVIVARRQKSFWQNLFWLQYKVNKQNLWFSIPGPKIRLLREFERPWVLLGVALTHCSLILCKLNQAENKIANPPQYQGLIAVFFSCFSRTLGTLSLLALQIPIAVNLAAFLHISISVWL